MAADGTNASSDDSQEPERKKLRFSEPDLKITVGETDNAVVYWYHSQIMANHSHYIDTMLASPMKESESYEISFPDIEPKVWDSMMKFVSNQVASRDMMVADVMLIATAYDQYDFATGLECCDRVLLDYFKKVYKTRREEPSDSDLDLDLVIDAFLFADKAHLEEAKKKGIEFFKYGLTYKNHYGRCMFGESCMKRLAQIIARENLLSHAEDEWTKEVILSPIFPTLFVKTMSLHLARSQLDSVVTRIKLSSDLTTDITSDCITLYKKKNVGYACKKSVIWAEEFMKMRICLGWINCDDWVILGYSDEGVDDRILWKCPFSSDSLIPPKDHWVPVDEWASGTLKIEYC